VLVSSWQTYTITYGNNGNVDAYGVPVWFAISDDPDIEIEFIDFEMKTSDYAVEKGFSAEIEALGRYFETDNVLGEPFNSRVYPFMIPVIPAGSSSSIHIRVKSPRNFQMKVWSNPPWYKLTPILSEKIGGGSGMGFDLLTAACVIAILAEEAVDITVTALGEKIGCVYNVSKLMYETGNKLWNKKATVRNTIWESSIVGVDCAIGLSNINLIYKILGSFTVNFYKNISNLNECATTGRLNTALGMIVNTLFSLDPNEMIGPSGYGDNRWIRKNNTIPYTVLFENKSTATAPAHEVVITDTLDLNTFDIRDFAFGSFGFGDTTLLPNGNKLTQFSRDIDLRPGKNLITRVSGMLDTLSGVVRWEFHSLNTETLMPEEDPYLGFLPPNNAGHEGEGFVSFSVGLRPELGTGDRLKNKASIIFDVKKEMRLNVTRLKFNTICSSY